MAFTNGSYNHNIITYIRGSVEIVNQTTTLYSRTLEISSLGKVNIEEIRERERKEGDLKIKSFLGESKIGVSHLEFLAEALLNEIKSFPECRRDGKEEYLLTVSLNGNRRNVRWLGGAGEYKGSDRFQRLIEELNKIYEKIPRKKTPLSLACTY